MGKRAKPENEREYGIMGRITRLLELPEEIVLDLPLISMTGRSELHVENHKGVLEYTRERVRINTGCGVLKIGGKNLELSEITSEAVTVKGIVLALEYIV